MKNNSAKYIIPCFLAVSFGLLIIACQDRPALEPVAEDLQADMSEDAAQQSVDGVTILVEGSEWSESPDIKVNVTPLKVEIRNRGDVPLRVRYADIVLKGPEDNRFAPLPTFKVETTAEGESAIVDEDTSLYQPRHFAEGFHYAPHYHAVHPAYQPYPSIPRARQGS